MKGGYNVMTIYDLTIESAEINLLVTEGFIDKGKKVLEDAIKKVKEFVRKLIELVKKVFNNKLKTIKDMINEIKKTPSQVVDGATMVAKVVRLNDLLEGSEYTLYAIEKSNFSSEDIVNKSLETLTDELDVLRDKFNKTKDNIMEPFKGGDIKQLIQRYEKCASYCEDIGGIANRQGKRTRDMLEELKSPNKVLYPNTLKLSSMISTALTQISTILKFVFDAMIHSVKKLHAMIRDEE